MSEPWKTDPHHPTVPSALVTVLGRIVVNSAQLESVLVTMVGSLLGSTVRVQGPFGQSDLRKPDDEPGRLVDRLKQLAEKGMQGSLQADVIAFARRAGVLLSRRNDVVHCLWGSEPDAKGRFQSTSHKLGRRPYAQRELDSLADELAAQSFRAVPLLPRMNAAMPQTQETLRDVPADVFMGIAVKYGWA